MDVTTIKHFQANQMIMTCLMRHIVMPIDQTKKNNLSHATIC